MAYNQTANSNPYTNYLNVNIREDKDSGAYDRTTKNTRTFEPANKDSNGNANLFQGTHSIKDITSFMLMRGVTDFGDLRQYNLYESGYSFLVVIDIPYFLSLLLQKNSEMGKVIRCHTHILEYEFRGLSGLDNITTETGQLTNGINSINIINKVVKQDAGTFTMNYQEKLGGTITKAHEIYLTGIKDPRTEVKTYHGLIAAGLIDAGYENEIYKLMYIVTDNTLLNLEKAVYLTSGQITNVPIGDIYNVEKGTYEFKEVAIEMNAYPITSRQVNNTANILLKDIYDTTVWREHDYAYDGAQVTQQYNDIPINNTKFWKASKASTNSYASGAATTNAQSHTVTLYGSQSSLQSDANSGNATTSGGTTP